jgi:enoyl-CoA hydratase/carnithine racemase
MADFTTLRYEARDGLAFITLARPEKRNAMNLELFAELAEAADRAGVDPEARGVVLSGDGPSFCAGIDLSALGGLAGAPPEQFRTFLRTAQRPYLVLSGLPKPVVAAVQGHAIGAGFQLALACDLRIAADDAAFAMLEARYGLIPDLGGMHRLTRLVGPARTKELVWSARTVTAEEAGRIGLVDRVVAASSLAEEAEALAQAVTAHSPITAAFAKGLIDRANETGLEVELEREGQAQAAVLRTDDHREAIAAFLERRPPTFTGR